jgi:hypothetical protein
MHGLRTAPIQYGLIGRAIDAGELQNIQSAGDVSRPELRRQISGDAPDFSRMNGDIAYVVL